MIKLNTSVEDYFRYLNSSRGKIFALIMFIVCTILSSVVDPLILDLNNQSNQQLLYSHIFLASLSIITLLLINYLKNNKITNSIIYSYLLILTLTEAYVAGVLDTTAGRGASVFIGTVMLVSFTFFYKHLSYTLWFSLSLVMFVLFVLKYHESNAQLVSSLGNGIIFTLVIYFIRIFTLQQKVKEYESQKKLIKYILESKKQKKREKENLTLTVTNNELLDKLLDYVVTQKRYLDSNLSLSIVAREIGTNTKYLSQIINTYYSKNFNSFINEYRIEEAKRLMRHKLSNVLTIEAIAQQAGFNSKSSFYSAFKAYSGQTPSDFLKNKL